MKKLFINVGMWDVPITDIEYGGDSRINLIVSIAMKKPLRFRQYEVNALSHMKVSVLI